MKSVTLTIQVFVLIGIVHLSGCKNEQKSDADTFKELLNKIEPSELPISIKACDFKMAGLKPLKDSPLSKYQRDPAYGVCYIPGNGEYIATVTFTRVECLIPYLSTYTLSGELIDEVCITSGTCVYDCGYTCEEGTIISKDLSFIIADSISTMDCDSFAMDLSPTPKNYIVYQTGRITPEGQIELSEEMRKPWKKNN